MDERDLHYLDTIKNHASEFDCDIDGDNDGPAATDQEVPTGHATPLSTDHGNSSYRLQPLISSRLTTIECISSIPFLKALANLQSETKMWS